MATNLRVGPEDLYIAIGKLYMETKKLTEYGEQLEEVVADQQAKIKEFEAERDDAATAAE